MVWNQDDKKFFEDVTKHNTRVKRLALGLANECNKSELRRALRKKKPRPADIMEERRMVGKYGPIDYCVRQSHVHSEGDASSAGSEEGQLVEVVDAQEIL